MHLHQTSQSRSRRTAEGHDREMGARRGKSSEGHLEELTRSDLAPPKHEFVSNEAESAPQASADSLIVRLSARDGWPSPVEGAALEMLYRCKPVLGSNPNPSARLTPGPPRLASAGVTSMRLRCDRWPEGPPGPRRSPCLPCR